MRIEEPRRAFLNAVMHTARRILLAALILQFIPDVSAVEKPEKMYKRAQELRRAGKLEEARVALQYSLQLKPDYAKAKALLGLTCFQIGEQLKGQGNAASALAMFQEAVAVDPEEAYWHAALSQAMRNAGDAESASKECDEAARLSPLDALLGGGCRPPEAAAEVLSSDKIPPGTVKREISPPSLIKRKEPPYTEKARQALHQGVARLQIVVSAQGDVSGMAIIKPLGLGLDQQALKTVSAWKFEPARLNGVPIGVRIIVEVQFHLY